MLMLIGLSYGSSRYSWSSWRILVPLIFGLIGTFLFYLYEASPFCVELILPPRILISNRTTTIRLILAFVQFMFLYFLPVFQRTTLGCIRICLIKDRKIQNHPYRRHGVAHPWTGPFYQTWCRIICRGIGDFPGCDSLGVWHPYVDHVTGRASRAPWLQPQHGDFFVRVGQYGVLQFQGQFSILSSKSIWRNISAIRMLFIHWEIDQLTPICISGSYINSLPPGVASRCVYVDTLQMVWVVSTGLSALSSLLWFFEKEVTLRTTGRQITADLSKNGSTVMPELLFSPKCGQKTMSWNTLRSIDLFSIFLYSSVESWGTEKPTCDTAKQILVSKIFWS